MKDKPRVTSSNGLDERRNDLAALLLVEGDDLLADLSDV